MFYVTCITSLCRRDITICSIQKHINEDSTLITDSKSCYSSFCEINNLKHISIKSHTYKSDSGHSLSAVNSLHTELELFLKMKRGINVRHIQRYLDFFSFKKRISYKYENLFLNEEVYRKTLSQTKNFYSSEISKSTTPFKLCSMYPTFI